VCERAVLRKTAAAARETTNASVKHRALSRVPCLAADLPLSLSLALSRSGIFDGVRAIRHDREEEEEELRVVSSERARGHCWFGGCYCQFISAS